MIDRLLSRRYLRQRRGRAALIVASIALGVATLVSTQTLNRVIETATTETLSPLKAAADLTIDNGTLGVQLGLASEIRKANLPGIRDVRALLFERITVPTLNDRPAVLIGADLGQSQSLSESSLGIRVCFTEPSGPVRFALGQCGLVSKPLFDVMQSGPQSIRLGNRERPLAIGGYFEADPESPAAALGRNVVVLELYAASSIVYPGTTRLVNRIDVTVDPAQREAARNAVQGVIGERGIVATADSHAAGAQEIIAGVKTSLTLCSLGALVVGLFLVYNAMAVTVAERRPDIGILRAVGASRGQIVRTFGVMAAILGTVGAACGIPLGLLMANNALEVFRDALEGIFLNPEVVPTAPTISVIALAFFAGVATSVLAALVPALQAASDPPSDTMRRGRGYAGPFWRWLHRGICGVLIFGGLAMILTREHLPHRLGSFGGMMTVLVGLLLAAPIFVSVVVAIVNPMLRRVLPIEARLAADNLTRAPGRTGVVIGALGAGVAVMLQTAGVGKSNEVPIIEWLNRMVRADQYVFGGDFATGLSSQSPMEPRVVEDLRRLPGIAMSTGLRFARPEYNGTIIYLLVVDTDPFSEHLGRRSDLPSLKILPLAQGHRVVASENFLVRHKARVGDTVTLPGPKGSVSLQIAAAIPDYSWSRGTLIIDRSAYAQLFGDPQIDLAHVFFADEAIGRPALQDYLDRHGLVALPSTTMREHIGGFVTRFYTLAYLQQLVVGIVAALGVVTALLISVLQRKRELGLLLAVGATPGQVVRSVLWEALFMGAVGTLLGFAIGIPIEWFIIEVIFYEETGFVLTTLIPWREALTIGVGSMLIAALAGVLPAWHAMRTRIPEAIAYE